MEPTGQAPASTPLRVRRAASRVFGGRSDGPLDPELRPFLADMVRPYGNALREDLLAEPNGHTYAVMGEALMTEVSPDHPVDLLVLASAIHDIQLARPTASYLSSICPGTPVSFAICDQGSAGAHTALRLVRDYAAAGDCRRALLILAEQAAVHYEPSVVDGPTPPIPDRPAAVMLLCDTDDSAGGAELLAVRQHHHVAAADAGALLAAEVALLAADPTGAGVTLVLAEGAAALVPGSAPLVERVVAAPSGQPFTGAWCELAALLSASGPETGLVLVADYDASLRYLCVTAVDLVGADGRSAHALPVAAHPGRSG